MSQSNLRKPLLLHIHDRFLRSNDTVGFVFAIRAHYSSSTLARLAVHGDCRIRCAAVFALGFVGQFADNHTVGMALLDDDRTVRLAAERACRRVWNRDGTSAQRRSLKKVVRAIAAAHYRDASEAATSLLEDAPCFAEAWYQRGVARYRLGDLSRAVEDWHQALELNAYHFVAATAIGEACLRLKLPAAALESFCRALRLNPDLDKVRAQVAELVRQLKRD